MVSRRNPMLPALPYQLPYHQKYPFIFRANTSIFFAYFNSENSILHIYHIIIIIIWCSGMFWNVPCSWFYRQPIRVASQKKRQIYMVVYSFAKSSLWSSSNILGQGFFLGYNFDLSQFSTSLQLAVCSLAAAGGNNQNGITWSMFCQPQRRKDVITWPEFLNHRVKLTVWEVGRKKALVNGRLRWIVHVRSIVTKCGHRVRR